MSLCKMKHFVIPILASTMLMNPFIQEAEATVNTDSFLQRPYPSIVSLCSTTEEHGSIEFESLKVESTGLSILPGTHDPIVQSIKEILVNYNLVSHTQMRGSNIDLYDGKLVTLVHTLSEFCSYVPTNDQIDDSILYIINNLKELSPEMLNDIQLTYKKKLVEENKDGTVGYDGSVYNRYLFTQTDPEWMSESYGNESEGTIASSACGPTAMATILSSYFHREILPPEISDFSVSRGHRFSTGTATSLFWDAANYYGMPAPVEVGRESVEDMYEGIRDQGHMVIALMGKGCFTGSGHYVVLVGTEERNGKKYFLVSDPNFPNRNYSKSSKLIDEDPNDGFVLAETSIFEKESKGFSWFKTDFRNVYGDFQTNRTEILLADYSDEEFLSMIPVAVSQIVNKDTLYQIAENNQNDSYARNPLAIPNSTEVYTFVAKEARIR